MTALAGRVTVNCPACQGEGTGPDHDISGVGEPAYDVPTQCVHCWGFGYVGVDDLPTVMAELETLTGSAVDRHREAYSRSHRMLRAVERLAVSLSVCTDLSVDDAHRMGALGDIASRVHADVTRAYLGVLN